MVTLTFLLVVIAIVGQVWGDGVISTRSQLAQAVNGFSQRLYKQIGKEDKDLVYSPYSIHSALSMTSLGARGDTLTEMQTTLGISSIPQPHTAYMDAITELNSVRNVTLDVANGIFTNPNLQVKAGFIQAVKANYLGMADNFDLTAQGGPEKKINDYVAKNTNDVIKDLLPANSIGSHTLAVLINTIFFNGTWLTPFSKYATKKDNFTKSDGSLTHVDMMGFFKPISVNLLHDDVNQLDMIDLPFKNTNFSLYIVLPRDNQSMAKLESDPANIQRASDQQSSLRWTHGVRVQIPKFRIEAKQNLIPTLTAMGMVKPFVKGAANFSGMTDIPAYIGDAIHKAVIDVQETGTVAAAATSIGVVAMSMPMETDAFIANRPFLFFLKEKITDHILFQGKFTGH